MNSTNIASNILYLLLLWVVSPLAILATTFALGRYISKNRHSAYVIQLVRLLAVLAVGIAAMIYLANLKNPEAMPMVISAAFMVAGLLTILFTLAIKKD